MSLFDIIFRIDEICKKYDKYDIDKQRERNAHGNDVFARLYATFEDQIDSTLQKAEMASMETNRAKSVAMNAEVRRTKARLLDEVPKLAKLSQKKVKGLSREDLAGRSDLVLALPERIQAIPDGNSAAPNKSVGRGSSSDKKHINFETDGNFTEGYFAETEESSQFRNEYEMRKTKQDQGLDVISSGLDTLKNLANDMNEELDKQVPLIDEIDTKVDKNTAALKNTNVRLKEQLHQMRSSRNFCIDIILMFVILGIASYLYNILK
ncbi:syntaxin-71 [Heracleum sosnowskyi]|uniref:Syntaxin-71 n=1 Tax=Heracleum sosnowskyi TaxID=360622 RepID=A0AAD8J7T4_9APIA|nr:syntaxin-71 [Heracleum sosnowskyi]